MQRAAITGRRELYFLQNSIGCRWRKSFTTFFAKKSLILKPSYKRPSTLNMNSLKNNNKMETKVVSFEQMPESAFPLDKKQHGAALGSVLPIPKDPVVNVRNMRMNNSNFIIQ